MRGALGAAPADARVAAGANILLPPPPGQAERISVFFNDGLDGITRTVIPILAADLGFDQAGVGLFSDRFLLQLLPRYARFTADPAAFERDMLDVFARKRLELVRFGALDCYRDPEAAFPEPMGLAIEDLSFRVPLDRDALGASPPNGLKVSFKKHTQPNPYALPEQHSPHGIEASLALPDFRFRMVLAVRGKRKSDDHCALLPASIDHSVTLTVEGLDVDVGLRFGKVGNLLVVKSIEKVAARLGSVSVDDGSGLVSFLDALGDVGLSVAMLFGEPSGCYSVAECLTGMANLILNPDVAGLERLQRALYDGAARGTPALFPDDAVTYVYRPEGNPVTVQFRDMVGKVLQVLRADYVAKVNALVAILVNSMVSLPAQDALYDALHQLPMRLDLAAVDTANDRRRLLLDFDFDPAGAGGTLAGQVPTVPPPPGATPPAPGGGASGAVADEECYRELAPSLRPGFPRPLRLPGNSSTEVILPVNRIEQVIYEAARAKRFPLCRINRAARTAGNVQVAVQTSVRPAGQIRLESASPQSASATAPGGVVLTLQLPVRVELAMATAPAVNAGAIGVNNAGGPLATATQVPEICSSAGVCVTGALQAANQQANAAINGVGGAAANQATTTRAVGAATLQLAMKMKLDPMMGFVGELVPASAAADPGPGGTGAVAVEILDVRTSVGGGPEQPASPSPQTQAQIAANIRGLVAQATAGQHSFAILPRIESLLPELPGFCRVRLGLDALELLNVDGELRALKLGVAWSESPVNICDVPPRGVRPVAEPDLQVYPLGSWDCTPAPACRRVQQRAPFRFAAGQTMRWNVQGDPAQAREFARSEIDDRFRVRRTDDAVFAQGTRYALDLTNLSGERRLREPAIGLVPSPLLSISLPGTPQPHPTLFEFYRVQGIALGGSYVPPLSWSGLSMTPRKPMLASLTCERRLRDGEVHLLCNTTTDEPSFLRPTVRYEYLVATGVVRSGTELRDLAPPPASAYRVARPFAADSRLDLNLGPVTAGMFTMYFVRVRVRFVDGPDDFWLGNKPYSESGGEPPPPPPTPEELAAIGVMVGSPSGGTSGDGGAPGAPGSGLGTGVVLQ